jgi:ubiquilin
MQLTISISSGSRFTVSLNQSNDTATVRDVKQAIFTHDGTAIALQRLVYKGRILEDDRILNDYDIVDNSTVFLVKSRPTTATPSTPTAPPTTTTTTPQRQTQQPQFPPPNSQQEMMNSPAMQRLLDNPDVLQNMMQAQMRDNPALQQMMENNSQVREVLQDPAALRQMIQMIRDPQALQLAQRQQDLALR